MVDDSIHNLLSTVVVKCFVSIGLGALGQVLVVVYTYRGNTIRVISARAAAAHERAEYEAGLR